MREIEVNIDNLEKFISNIRDSDRQELIYFLGKNYKNKFIKTLLSIKEGTYFLEYNSNPACIGGIYNNEAGGQIWLLCAKEYDKKYLYKYIKEKIILFIKNNDYLYNFIYKTNFGFLKFLLKMGFQVTELDNPDIKLFYFKRRKN